MNRNQLAKGLVLFAITSLMVYDFFPIIREQIHVPKRIVVLLLLVIVLLGFFIGRAQSANTSRSSFWWEVTLIVWISALLVLFTLLGGHSDVGISISNPVLWLVLVISLFQLKREHKKLKIAEEAA